MARRQLHDRRSRNDAAYRRAKEDGYAARAVYKLEEINQKFKLLTPGRRVLDLGCWPGSWTQFAAAKVGEEGFVLGLDRVEVEETFAPWAKTLVADVHRLAPAEVVKRFGDFDVLISDMAPKTTGDRATDVFRSEELTRRALHFATTVLRPGGHYVAKVFVGGGFQELLREVRAAFAEVKPFHAKNTRAGSTEQYIVGRGLKASARTLDGPPSSP